MRFGDIDSLHHVNNVSIVQYYDLGLSHYMRNLKISNVFNGDGMAKVHTEMNFYDSILFDEPIEVQTHVSKIGNKSLTVMQKVIQKETGRVKSDCLTVLAGFNADTRTSAEISKDWKHAIAEHENIQY